MFDSIINSSLKSTWKTHTAYVKSRLQIKLELFFYEKTDAKLNLVMLQGE